jgi:hypothetical protein
MPAGESCALCGRRLDDPSIHSGALGASVCPSCARGVGKLFEGAHSRLEGAFPVLAALEGDEGDPREPKMRTAGGRTVELRSHTAQLRKGLAPRDRVRLAVEFLEIDLYREALLEATLALVGDLTPAEASRALDVVFNPKVAAPHAVERVRDLLFPQ